MSQTYKIQARTESQFLKNVITAESQARNSNWITIQEPSVTKLVLESLGDADTKSILTSVLDKPRTIAEILQVAKVPQTSGYRKANSLIDGGLLTVQGYITTHDGKRVNKYKAIFDNMVIDMEKGSVVIKILLAKNN